MKFTCLIPLLAAVALSASAQKAPATESPAAASPPAAGTATPIPDIATFLQQVISHQRQAESIRKDYIYETTVRMDKLNKDGSVKKDETEKYEDFTVDGVSVSRHLQHNGKDLSPDELKKENERIDKEVEKKKEKRTKADAEGKDTNSRGDELIPISRMFELGAFTNPRRVQVDGRDTIAVDFTGDPKAKTHNRGEDVIHDIAGTAWLDEQDKTIQHLEGRFINSFKIFGGMVASVAQGTTFDIENRKINGELWLPADIKAHGHFRILLLFAADGDFEMQTGNYRKFKTKSTILPGVTKVDPDPSQP